MNKAGVACACLLTLAAASARADASDVRARAALYAHCYKDKDFSDQQLECGSNSDAYFRLQTKENCGYKLGVAVDDAVVAADLDQERPTYANLDAVFDAIRALCADSDASKASVAAKIKSVHYVLEKTTKPKDRDRAADPRPTFKLAKGVLTVGRVDGDSDYERAAADWLTDNLNPPPASAAPADDR